MRNVAPWFTSPLCWFWQRVFILSLILVSSFGSWAVAQESVPGVAEVIVHPDGQEEIVLQNPEGVAAAQANGHFFTLRPSIVTTTDNYGLQEKKQFWFCQDLNTGELIPFSDMSFKVERESQTGGHDHSDDQRSFVKDGTWEPSSGNTGDDAFLPITYTAPEVSGVVNLRVDCFPPGYIPSIGLFTLGIEIEGLVGLNTSSPLYNVTGVGGRSSKDVCTSWPRIVGISGK